MCKTLDLINKEKSDIPYSVQDDILSIDMDYDIEIDIRVDILTPTHIFILQQLSMNIKSHRVIVNCIYIPYMKFHGKRNHESYTIMVDTINSLNAQKVRLMTPRCPLTHKHIKNSEERTPYNPFSNSAQYIYPDIDTLIRYDKTPDRGYNIYPDNDPITIENIKNMHEGPVIFMCNEWSDFYIDMVKIIKNKLVDNQEFTVYCFNFNKTTDIINLCNLGIRVHTLNNRVGISLLKDLDMPLILTDIPSRF